MSEGAGERLRQARIHCDALARRQARDLWIGALFAPERVRWALHALAAFEWEIRQAAVRVREPHAAALRLAWWSEAVESRRDAEAAGSPVATALLAARDAFDFPSQELAAMIDAAPPPDLATSDLPALTSLADAAEGARIRLAARALDPDADPASAAAAAAQSLALVRWMLTSPPADVTSERLADFRALAREKLGEAEAQISRLPPAVLPAFASLGVQRLDLERLERGAARPAEPPPDVAPWRRQWAIWRWLRRR